MGNKYIQLSKEHSKVVSNIQLNLEISTDYLLLGKEFDYLVTKDLLDSITKKQKKYNNFKIHFRI